MKKKLFVFIFLISSFIAKSQTTNIVKSSEFEGIKINNTTLNDLKKTKGKQAAVENLLGAVTSYNVDENENYYYFVFKGLKVDFSTLGRSKPYIESFEINSSESSLNIKNIAVTVGDNISKLGTVVFSVGRNGSKSILYSVCEDCDSFVYIEFDQATNIITKISYMDMG
ncbi:hypothetical protein H0I31_05455 [Tenacibaculum sp. AHE15PA]|uniref:hypothetical protein n=1 Tax=Tenacibaculum TaxID=104267 RepID=UPI001C4F78D1|nr:MULTISPECIES: hypothetical protein [Tenacibaculum]QXP73145.1 hypothetical protein H0I30_10715 [Tenacibaculum sp. AHE14PA]QXP77058.1 hypothetical protein H0I31_05455 [Tenacibaculum sp. AHE15PA]